MKNYSITLFLLAFIFNSNAQNQFKRPLSKPLVPISLNKNLFLTKIKADPLKIERAENGLPVFIHGKIPNLSSTKHARGTVEAKAFGYLESIKNTLKIAYPQDEFQITTSEIDQLNQQHIRMNQFYKGIPVYGGEMILHTDGQEVDKMNGRYFPTPILPNIKPTIEAQQAVYFAIKDLSKTKKINILSEAEKSLLKYTKPKTELLIYHVNEDIDSERLVWKIEIRPNLIERWDYFVDAINGNVVDKFNHTCVFDGPTTANAKDLNNVTRSIKTYQTGSAFNLIDTSKDMFPGGPVNTEDPQGVLWTIDGGNTTPEDLSVKQVASSNNVWSNPTAVSAHYNAGIAYDYYKKTFNRLSLNGKGGTIISIINVTETNETTGKVQQMDNAFWNGEFMAYGNGNTFFKPLAGGLDVAGHEMTHGVIENTANLNYQGQSGAINESMADVFGVMIDRQDGDWVVGEDVMKNGKSFLRSLPDPNTGDQPASMSQIYTGSEDNGGVHINSGIPNRAFYLFATALTGTEEQKKAKAEQVYYRALTKYLTRSSKFIDLRAAIVQSCTDLAATVGADAVAAANSAFNKVGIGNSGSTAPPTTKPVDDLPVNAGSEFILSYDPCEKAIYSSKEVIKTDADFHKVVSNVIIDHKPSITDDGTFAYYIDKKAVGGGGTLNRVNLNGTPKVEVLDDQVVWTNVAVSKDGKKLALNTIETTENDQQYIYIISLETGTLKGLKLYNPTYSNTVKSSGTPLFSDALEWEYDGESVIYDAYNQINSNTLAASSGTSTLDYWDVGEIKAWDASKNVVGDGTITKIFTNLAKNESIGNPTLAKKSTSVVAFDHLLNSKYSVLTIDFESKGADGSYKRGEIANNTIGFPGFSAKDDKLIFTKEITPRRKCTTGSIDSTNTVSMSLNTDKVTATGTSNAEFIVTSSLAVWYIVGQRALPTTQSVQVINFPIVSNKVEGPSSSIDLPAATDKGTSILYKVLSGPATISNGKIVLTGKPGRVRVQGNAAAITNAAAVESILDFCVNPTKPTITVTEKTASYVLTSSADLGNIWLKDGDVFANNTTKTIEINNSSNYTVKVAIDGCESIVSENVKVGAVVAQTIAVVTIADKLEGDKSSITLAATTDVGNAVTYSTVSGPASISGNKIVLSGQPGRVKVKGTSPATIKNSAAEVNYEFCVNPSKPTITITTGAEQYVFKSSANTGNNWYKNGVSINETSNSINVVTTATFTVQVIIEGCKSEFSDGKAATKEFVLGEEPLAKAGIAVYPNPVQDNLYLKFGNTKINQISIVNLAGIAIYEKENLKTNELNIDLKNLPKGLYILRLSTSKGDFSKKLYKE